MYLIFFYVNINIGDCMLVRLGYVAISTAIDVTSSSPYTYSEYLNKGNIDKLDDIIKSNLLGLEEILKYNVKNNIHFYRMSSKIIPLATKDDVKFNYTTKYKKYYNRISKIINDNNLRVDFHPDQFCVLNSTNKDVVKNSIDILDYHYKLLNMMKIKDKVLILHVGSNVLGKNNSIKRFVNNFNKLPDYLKKCIAIENDDKVFNVSDTLKISDMINVPIVLDYHHYKCNKSDIDIERIFKTWNIKPKLHFSSPKNKKNFRSHSDYINSNDFIEFIELIKKYNTDVDIMLEAKMKDEALSRLVRELKYKTNYNFIDDTSFEV